jgi:hypothetical protein
VSRGRKPKKSKKRQQGVRRIGGTVRRVGTDAEFGKLSGSPFRTSVDVLESFLGQGREPEWWEPSHQRVIDASRGLLAAASPRALEQAVAELIGGELYAAVNEGRSGLRLDVWAMELTDRLVSRIADTAGQEDWQGVWWLLQGLASIGSYGLGGWAEEQARKAAVSLPAGWQASQPSWLESVTRIAATGDVRSMRDAYGTRFGVIAEFGYPGDSDPFWYLFDIDVSGSIVFESEEHEIDGAESRTIMDNWFRGPRRIADLLRTLDKRGMDLSAHRSLYLDVAVEPMADAFTAWYSERHGRPPGSEVAEALAAEWLEGMLPGTEHAVSPGRSSLYRKLISGWLDDPVTVQVLAVLPEWVRWHGEQSGVPAHLLDIAVAAAHAPH